MASSSIASIATVSLGLVLFVSVARAQVSCVTCNSAVSTQSWCADPYIPPSQGPNTTVGPLCYKSVYTTGSGQLVFVRGSMNSAGFATANNINTGCSSNLALTALPSPLPAGNVCTCNNRDVCNAATVIAAPLMLVATAGVVVLFFAARRLH